MKQLIRTSIKKIVSFIPLAWIEKILVFKMGYPVISYGPDGEDVILRNMSGINIDAMPGSMTLFNKERPRDINLEIGISEKPATLTYHMFEEQAYNTFSEMLATSYMNTGHVRCKKIRINTLPLSTILDTYIKPSQKIDLLSIDVEGYDMAVLRSNNWNTYRPRVIAIEDIGFNTEAPHTSEIFNFLKNQGYHLEVATPKTLFFRIQK